jgi:hypothetical protein
MTRTIMSLDVYLDAVDQDGNHITVFEENITHNLGPMANAAGVYYYLWRPEERQCYKAYHLIFNLEKALKRLRKWPAYYDAWNPQNGWGDYEALVGFIERYLAACQQYPSAKIYVSR